MNNEDTDIVRRGPAEEEVAEADEIPLPFMGIEGASFTETGVILPKGVSYDKWESALTLLNQIRKGVPWAIGDLLNYGEREYGEMYAQAMVFTGRSYSNLGTLKYVAGVFRMKHRREELEFGHHEVVASLFRENPQVAIDLLQCAIDNDQSVHELRAEVVKARVALEIEGLQKDEDGNIIMPSDPMEAYRQGEKLGAIILDTAPSSVRNEEHGANLGWLDELLSIVAMMALANHIDETWEMSLVAARWAQAHGFPISKVFEVAIMGGMG